MKNRLRSRSRRLLFVLAGTFAIIVPLMTACSVLGDDTTKQATPSALLTAEPTSGSGPLTITPSATGEADAATPVPSPTPTTPDHSLVADAFSLDMQLVADGFTEPTDIVDPRDGSDRLFVVERRGVVRVIQQGAVLDTPFLDLSDHVSTASWETGMLSIVFHPDYAHNGTFFITYSPTPDEWRMERYQVSADPNRADVTSAKIVLSIPHPGDTHYAGKMIFGEDGYLWVSVGDGGGGYDLFGNSQDLNSLLGKILRIDIDAGEPYAIPPDNPFVATPDARPEIWAYGLRNPWRFSFDRETGDLYIGDVGETSWEEVNHEPADSPGGNNYGWPLMEGMQCSAVALDCDPSLYVAPIVQYGHDQGCVVTGGYVYRGDSSSPLWGTYVFSDFCVGTVWTMQRSDGDQWIAEVQLSTPLRVTAFGEDTDGNLYLADFGGSIQRLLAPTGTPTPHLLRSEPSELIAGGVACTLVLRGWSFAPDAQVLINGTPHAATVVNSTWITLDWSSDEVARPGTMAIVVDNGDGQQSMPWDVVIAASVGSDDAIYDRWARDDLPVATGSVSRTWLWGSSGISCAMSEAYADAADGQRVVQYFDKSRMEITNPYASPADDWYVTNGLLATELITGNLQLGDTSFEQRAPAEMNVAGDINDPTAPTYATFATLLNAPALADGSTISQRVQRDGQVSDDPAMAELGVTAAYHVQEPGIDHQVASPFWEYMNLSGFTLDDGTSSAEQGDTNPFYATGLPITEAYWVTVAIAGEPHDVLAQCFERRCLTYTPTNPEGWQVEAGNVGQHYYRWRYAQ